MTQRPLLPDAGTVRRVDRHSEPEQEAGAIVATQDHELIRQWAARHHAEPATGEASASGPATQDVQDGGAGIRFNFPAAGAFRPISWDEWLGNLAEYDLAFVYERDTPGRTPSSSYRLVPRSKLPERETAE